MGKPVVQHCGFPGCDEEILKGASMCTLHWRLYHAVTARKEHRGKQLFEVVDEIKALQNKYARGRRQR